MKNLKDCGEAQREERSGNIFIRGFVLFPGETIEGHEHEYHHLRIFTQGRGYMVDTHPDGLIEEHNVEGATSRLVHAKVSHKVVSTVPTIEEAKAELAQLTPEEIKERLLGFMTLPLKGMCVFSLRDAEGHVIEELEETDAARIAMLKATT